MDRTLLGANDFVYDATYVLLGEQTCVEACPESGTPHLISAFLTQATPVSRRPFLFGWQAEN
jgi:hypothetical protein